MMDPEFLNKLDAIQKKVKDADGVLTVSMKELKELHGALRLKELVRESIAEHLKYKQIGFVGVGPGYDELPNSENEWVRLYMKGTPVARIVEAVLLKGNGGDQQLRELASSSSAVTTQDIIQKMKLLIAQFDQSAGD
jgi:hypothetical protein